MSSRNGSSNGNGVQEDTAPVSSTGQAIVSRNSNGAHSDPAIIDGHDLLWDGLSPAVTQALGQPIDLALVSQRKGRGGKTFSYIEGHTAIDEANRVFGFGGWGFDLVENVTLRRIETVDTQTGEVKVVNTYTAPVQVNVPGAPPRTDIGFHAVTDETADGHETAIKGAVTDGLKRGAPQLRTPLRERPVRRPAAGGQPTQAGAGARPVQRRVRPSPGQPPRSAGSEPALDRIEGQAQRLTGRRTAQAGL